MAQSASVALSLSPSAYAELIRREAALTHSLREERYEFEFVEGELPCPSAEGVQTLITAHAECFQYFDPCRHQTITDAVVQAHELLASEEPPFEGIIGFSQGAMLAATVLIDQARDPHSSLSPPLKCAMLVCSPLPFDMQGRRRFQDGAEYSELISVPTFHVFGKHDEYFAESIGVSHLCKSTLRQTYDHGGGHEIPKQQAVTKALAEGLRKCVLSAQLLQ